MYHLNFMLETLSHDLSSSPYNFTSPQSISHVQEGPAREVASVSEAIKRQYS